jgi:signal transduction histidine kinase
MSHELRTPLHGILSYARFGLRGSAAVGRDELQDYFENIEDSGRGLLQLLNDLLDLAKLEAGKMTFELVEADLCLEVLDAVDEFRSLASEKHLVIAKDTADGSGPRTPPTAVRSSSVSCHAAPIPPARARSR